MSNWKPVDGNIATPEGFRAAATSAGIKQGPGALDLALIFSEVERTRAAAVFTTNRVVAAPVVLGREHLRRTRGRLRAIIVNSGNANACNGPAGLRASRATAEAVGKLLGVSHHEVLVSSTGIIGVPLDPKLILNCLPALKENLSKVADVVGTAIMTTDTVPKSAVVRASLGGKRVHIAGVAKGAGMIHPHMATMLCYITTDLAIEGRTLQAMLREAVGETFNRITVDGDISTNDTVAVLANGASGLPVIRRSSRHYTAALSGLKQVCSSLARKIVTDGEGAKRFIEIEVRGARNAREADLVGRAIANSALVKTAFTGADANWGRILCAAGYSGAKIDPDKIEIRVGGLTLCHRGQGVAFDEDEARKRMDRKEVSAVVDLHQGKASTRLWTCDLTEDYIKINALYRT